MPRFYIVFFMMIFALTGVINTSFAAQKMTDEEFVGPFSTWANAKKDYGAVGDGKTDDTAALQQALDDMGLPTSKHHQLWLPSGTYRITKTLKRTGVSGIYLIGEDPANTIIRWDGPAWDGDEGNWKDPKFSGIFPSDMFWFNGSNSRFERLTFDGGGKAFSCIAFRWNQTGDNSNQTSSHRISLSDVWFKDSAIGFDGGGKLIWLDSEVLLKRCRFQRCSLAGASTRTFNACDWWFWNCLFEDCTRGVTNVTKYYGGHYHVYESIFRRSKEADLSIYHTAALAARNNISIDSKRFYHAENNGANGALLTLQGNMIINPIADDALWFETIGNINLMDNTIISRPQAKGPVVRAGIAQKTAPEWEIKTNSKAFTDGWCPVSVTAIGNIFTVATPIEVRGKIREIDTKTVKRSSLKPVIQDVPETLKTSKNKIFEVTAGANETAIQTAIDNAVQHAIQNKGSIPVIHLPMAVYSVTKTIVMPANQSIQIIGDGYYSWPDGIKGTVLKWTGKDTKGPVLLFKGPSKAIIRDFAVLGPSAQNRGANGPPVPQLDNGIVVENYDQQKARVYLQECNISGLFGLGILAENLDNANIQAIAHEGSGYDYNWRREWDKPTANDPYLPYPAVRVTGGPLAKKGKATKGQVNLFGVNCSTYDAWDGGSILVRDQWAENNNLPFHMILKGNGRITMDTCKEALFLHPTLQGVGAAYRFEGFTGQLSLINTGGESYDNPLMSFTGDCRGANIFGLGTVGDGGPNWLPDTNNTAGAKIGIIQPRRNYELLPNFGIDDDEYIKSMVQQTRITRPEIIIAKPAGITDLRLYRILTDRTRVGLYLKNDQ